MKLKLKTKSQKGIIQQYCMLSLLLFSPAYSHGMNREFESETCSYELAKDLYLQGKIALSRGCLDKAATGELHRIVLRTKTLYRLSDWDYFWGHILWWRESGKFSDLSEGMQDQLSTLELLASKSFCLRPILGQTGQIGGSSDKNSSEKLSRNSSSQSLRARAWDLNDLQSPGQSADLHIASPRPHVDPFELRRQWLVKISSVRHLKDPVGLRWVRNPNAQSNCVVIYAFINSLKRWRQ